MSGNGAYGIFVDVSRPRDWRQLSWQLAHEVGHCATGCTHKLSSPYDLIARHEYKADRWAITRYLGWRRPLRRAMAAGCTEPWQLAEYFDLPQSAVEQALHYWVDCRGVDFNALPEDGPAPAARPPLGGMARRKPRRRPGRGHRQPVGGRRRQLGCCRAGCQGQPGGRPLRRTPFSRKVVISRKIENYW